MNADQSPPSPHRVAVVGAGPAGFFLTERLLRHTSPIEVDMFERLPTPYGLVRFGVAPDHEKIKNVARSFSKTAMRERFRFFGNVDVGTQVTLEELAGYYHAVCFATGAKSDRRMGIPGEELQGSHAATEFVAWYNGHPDYQACRFDLSAERVAVIGVGNVAVDVARILCRTPEELATTDLTDQAFEALAASRVKEVLLLGRRGPAQAAFTNPEVKELGELPGADVAVRAEEIVLDALSAAALEENDDQATRKKLEILTDFAGRTSTGKPRTLVMRFLVSPTELLGDDEGRVVGIRLQRNRLVARDGRLAAEPLGEYEEIPVGLVFRSVGYRGIPIPGLPFDERRGIVPNAAGRVTDGAGGPPLPGLYVSGWIKRGPTGVIGTNKPDAAETADCLLEDLANGVTLGPSSPDAGAVAAMLAERQPDLVSWSDWTRLEAAEVEKGAAVGKPRRKVCSVEEMLAAIRNG